MIIGLRVLRENFRGLQFCYGVKIVLPIICLAALPVKPHAGAMNLLHWSAMKLMKERGVKYYDFVGARINRMKEVNKNEEYSVLRAVSGGELKKGYLWKDAAK